MGPVAFYSKCRPQRADLWSISEDVRRVFIGYPPRRADTDSSRGWRRDGARSVFVDLLDPEWERIPRRPERRGYASQVTANRNLARKIGKDSIVVVPRPASGACFAARVTAPFELVDRPTWADRYLELRREKGLPHDDELSHVGDVVQTWSVAKWFRLPFVAVPRWISYQLLSRRTCGIIKDWPSPALSSWEALDGMLRKRAGEHYQPLRNEADLERALIDWLSPSAFEHLVVSLLQLEAPAGVYWHHVGGSGDGGVDGVAVDADGSLWGVLQCKWRTATSPARIIESLRNRSPRAFVAYLAGYESTPMDIAGGTFWDRKRVAELVAKHRDRLPFARSLGLAHRPASPEASGGVATAGEHVT